ncbi:hypothetical protein E5676_scaffold791G00110 [Cucumis melo var. makuwa]|uniref:Uncharacterized protein n=1 Tax=Cucumis melo var. makuwa TaxID=1194695 RepID=A0A5D3BC25_CUCMM|nr:hypothetical protein E5676_scaffold791G00110 [Cucumis melo var. makuwa]
MAAKNNTTERQEADTFQVAVEEFTKEMENMSPIEPRISPADLRLRIATQPNKTKKGLGYPDPMMHNKVRKQAAKIWKS